MRVAAFFFPKIWFFGKSGVSLHPRSNNVVTFKTIEIMLDTFFGFVQFVSFVIALVLGPFIVGSRMFAKWLVYLTLCTIFTPLFGILIYVKFFRY